MTNIVTGGDAVLAVDPIEVSTEPSTPVAAAAADAQDPLYLVAYCVMAGIMAVGLAGNLIVLLVYARKKDGHAANVFILSLAVSDLVACCLVIPMSIAMEVSDYVSSALACKLYYLLNCSGIPFSSMLMAAIAVERYFCICRPFLRAITVPRAKAIVLTLGSLAFCLGLAIAIFCSVVVRRVDPLAVNGTEASALEFADYGECREISELKRSLANESAATAARIHISDASLTFFNVFQKLHLSLFGICIALVFVLYVRIYVSVLRLRRQRRERRQNRQQLVRLGQAADDTACQDGQPPEVADGRAQNRRKSLRLVDSDALQNLKTAAMLFVVTIVFTGTFIPAALMIVKVIGFNVLIFYLYYLTHATNPLIYCFMNRNFREDLRKLFCPESAQRRQQKLRQRQQQQQQQQKQQQPQEQQQLQQQQQQKLLPGDALEEERQERRESFEASGV